MVIEPNPEFTKKVIESGGETLPLCFQCGTCTGSCPSGRLTAFRVRKLFRMAQLGMKDKILPSDELWHCTTCYTCFERCPRGVNTVDIIFTLRNLAVREGYMAEAHKKNAGFLYNVGHLVPLAPEYREKRKAIGLTEVPPTVLASKESLEQVQKLLEATGFNKLIGVQKK